jgi:hypothetical protein
MRHAIWILITLLTHLAGSAPPQQGRVRVGYRVGSFTRELRSTGSAGSADRSYLLNTPLLEAEGGYMENPREGGVTVRSRYTAVPAVPAVPAALEVDHFKVMWSHMDSPYGYGPLPSSVYQSGPHLGPVRRWEIK